MVTARNKHAILCVKPASFNQQLTEDYISWDHVFSFFQRLVSIHIHILYM